MCGRPRRWWRGEWRPYCGGGTCTNPVRICKNLDCSRPDRKFTASEGFTKFCSVECRTAVHFKRIERPQAICPVDGQEHRLKNRWGLCKDCVDRIRPAINTLNNHHVPTDLVVGLIKDPVCMALGCTANLLEYSYQPDYHRQRLALHVDHDHKCPICKGAPLSCGGCVRGLVCWRHNVICGIAEDRIDRLEGAAAYLRDWVEVRRPKWWQE